MVAASAIPDQCACRGARGLADLLGAHFSAEPRPTARTLATRELAGAGIRVSSSALPVAPTAMSLSSTSASILVDDAFAECEFGAVGDPM